MAALAHLAAMLMAGILRVIGKLRLAIPFIYVVLMCTVFSRWAAEYEPIAVGLLIAMMAVVAISWIVTAVKKVREYRGY